MHLRNRGKLQKIAAAESLTAVFQALDRTRGFAADPPRTPANCLAAFVYSGLLCRGGSWGWAVDEKSVSYPAKQARKDGGCREKAGDF
jgi:hypothetical protein